MADSKIAEPFNVCLFARPLITPKSYVTMQLLSTVLAAFGGV